MSEERRVVSVLFASVPGLEKLPGTMSAEDAAEVVDALFTRFRRVIEARGGTVDKFTGEQVMAVFGAPVAHEDDAVRAVRAALAMKRELDLFNAQRELALTLGAGINAGEVLWGNVGGDRPTAMGDVVNVANRLMSEAGAGEILVARAVERAAAYRIEFGPERELHVRGRQEAVAAMAVTGVKQTSSIESAAQSLSAPLVGRAGEFGRLVEAQVAGRGGFFLLEGEAGVGKTRLAFELRRAAAAAGAWTGVGHCHDGAPIPLAPFGEIVRSMARPGVATAPGTRAFGRGPQEDTGRWVQSVLEAVVASASDRENLARLMSQSLGEVTGQTRLANLAPRQVKQDTLVAWEKWIRALATVRPVVLCVEDLHWADGGTLALLEELAARLAGVRVVLVATSRPGTSRALRGFERIPLGELPPGEALALATALLGRVPDGDLSAFLVEQSGGNPHYLEELVRHLRDEGIVDGTPARFVTRPERLPEGLRGLVVARIDAVSPDAREALKTGSVFGRAFWVGAVGSLAGRDVEGPVELAERRDLVSRQDASLLPGDVEFAFRQSPVRDAAYSLLTRKERQRLHGKAADLLEPLGAVLGRRLTILAAGHREAAGQPAEASRLWELASQEALLQYAGDEALSSAREAQRLSGAPGAAIAAVRALNSLAQYEQAQAEADELLAAPGLAELDRQRTLMQLANAWERRG